MNYRYLFVFLMLTGVSSAVVERDANAMFKSFSDLLARKSNDSDKFRLLNNRQNAVAGTWIRCSHCGQIEMRGCTDVLVPDNQICETEYKKKETVDKIEWHTKAVAEHYSEFKKTEKKEHLDEIVEDVAIARKPALDVLFQFFLVEKDQFHKSLLALILIVSNDAYKEARDYLIEVAKWSEEDINNFICKYVDESKNGAPLFAAYDLITTRDFSKPRWIGTYKLSEKIEEIYSLFKSHTILR